MSEHEQDREAVGPRLDRGVGRLGPKRARLSANQLYVLHMACTHGHLTQGCMRMSDYGARTRTIYSLRKLGLLDVMDKPTDKGRDLHSTYPISKTPNVLVRRDQRP